MDWNVSGGRHHDELQSSPVSSNVIEKVCASDGSLIWPGVDMVGAVKSLQITGSLIWIRQDLSEDTN